MAAALPVRRWFGRMKIAAECFQAVIQDRQETLALLRGSPVALPMTPLRSCGDARGSARTSRPRAGSEFPHIATERDISIRSGRNASCKLVSHSPA